MKTVGYSGMTNNRWSMIQLANLTVPSQGSCIDIDMTFIGRMKLFLQGVSWNRNLVIEDSDSYRVLRRELTVREAGIYTLYVETAYVNSNKDGISFLVKQLAITEGICHIGELPIFNQFRNSTRFLIALRFTGKVYV